MELKIQLLPTGQKHGIAWHVAYQLVVLILTDIILLTFVDFLFVCLVISKNFNLSVVIVYLIGQFTLYYNNRVRDNFTFYFLSHQKVVSVGFSSPIPFTSTKIYLIIFNKKNINSTDDPSLQFYFSILFLFFHYLIPKNSHPGNTVYPITIIS